MATAGSRIWLLWLVAALALLEGGWFAFDGARTLVLGDYVTPTAGPHAGQLGPWADVVSAVGIEPRSTLMKVVHLGIGGAWLGTVIGFVYRPGHFWLGMVAFATFTLWYLPVGTLLSAVQLGLLFHPDLRRFRRST